MIREKDKESLVCGVELLMPSSAIISDCKYFDKNHKLDSDFVPSHKKIEVLIGENIIIIFFLITNMLLRCTTTSYCQNFKNIRILHINTSEIGLRKLEKNKSIQSKTHD